MNKLPDKWCVKSCPSNPLTDKLTDYANKYGSLPPYGRPQSNNIYYHFPACDGCTTSGRKFDGYTEITLKQFASLIDQPTKIEFVPIIEGESHHLKAFLEDCAKLGYRESRYNSVAKDLKYLRLNGNTDANILTNDDSFKIICNLNKNYYDGLEELKEKTFVLPQDWAEALDLMESNMKIWEDLNKQPEFKVGDIVHGTIGDIEYVGVYSAPNTMSSWKNIGGKYNIITKGNGKFNIIRFATPEEVEFFQDETKIFKMTSSSGDFELEVSKKGIYYRPENSWLDVDMKFIHNSPSRALNYIQDNGSLGAYKTTLTKMNVDCKHDCLVSEWLEVYEYYNSIKEC